MDGAHGAAHRVKEQDGRAVGAEGHQRHPGLVGNLSVADRWGLPEEPLAPVFPGDHADDVGVALDREDRVLRGKAQGLAEDAVVFIDVGGIVAPVVA